MKRESKMKFVPLEEAHIPELLKIADAELGENYLAAEYLAKVINDKSKIVLVAIKGVKVSGFGLASILTGPELRAKLLKGSEQLPEFAGRIGLIDNVAIKEDKKGLGIGSNIVEKLISELKQKGIKEFASVAWVPANETKSNLGNILEKNGIPFGYNVENYWTDDSLAKGYDCPLCGIHCACSANIHFA
ncbi:MAG: GNAT family N-acetyltransferase [Lactobacillales bacterium]|jgi:ribosomal protein S18 acetylase RimI-like enzyme|nr:GNAT family N-acetyltransferase [Lactobacillales bacterium]